MNQISHQDHTDHAGSTLLKQLSALTADCRYITTNCANAAALLFSALPQLNWAGFYFPVRDTLILGPFCGKPACIQIPFGKGVCGTAAAQKNAIIVPDVHRFPGHIACDSASASEIVVPLLKNDRLLAILDVDSPVKNRFSETDKALLKQAAAILIDACDWENFHMA